MKNIEKLVNLAVEIESEWNAFGYAGHLEQFKKDFITSLETEDNAELAKYYEGFKHDSKMTDYTKINNLIKIIENL